MIPVAKYLKKTYGRKINVLIQSINSTPVIKSAVVHDGFKTFFYL